MDFEVTETELKEDLGLETAQGLGQVSEQVFTQVSEQVSEQVFTQVSEQVSEQVFTQVSEQVSEQVVTQVSEQLLEERRMSWGRSRSRSWGR